MTHFVLFARTVDFEKMTNFKTLLLRENPMSIVHTIEIADDATDDEFKTLKKQVTQQIKASTKSSVVPVTEFE